MSTTCRFTSIIRLNRVWENSRSNLELILLPTYQTYSTTSSKGQLVANNSNNNKPTTTPIIISSHKNRTSKEFKAKILFQSNNNLQQCLLILWP